MILRLEAAQEGDGYEEPGAHVLGVDPYGHELGSCSLFSVRADGLELEPYVSDPTSALELTRRNQRIVLDDLIAAQEEL